MSFLPCPICDHHVSLEDSECPFCSAQLGKREAPADLRRGRRLGRVAAFTLQAAVASTTMAACDGVAEDGGGGATATGGTAATGGADGSGGAYGGGAGEGGEGGVWECPDACAIYSAIPTP
ncbi:MAG TPA: hypothetical protein VLC09_03000 [Polyangiaceae bacterium]|nr:hypothetical protein [Polyangiaceae bacterium]